jgi:hypothetical protein
MNLIENIVRDVCFENEINHNIIKEENHQLKSHIFQIPSKLYGELLNRWHQAENNSKYTNEDGYKRLHNIIKMEGKLSYEMIKRIKNFFDHYKGICSSKREDQCAWLNGGYNFKEWVNQALDDAEKDVRTSKKIASDSGLNNTFISAHYRNNENLKPITTSPTKEDNNIVKEGIRKNLNENITNVKSITSIIWNKIDECIKEHDINIYITEIVNPDYQIYGGFQITNLDFIGEMVVKYHICQKDDNISTLNKKYSYIKEGKIVNVSLDINAKLNDIQNILEYNIEELYEEYNHLREVVPIIPKKGDSVNEQQYKTIIGEYRDISGGNSIEIVFKKLMYLLFNHTNTDVIATSVYSELRDMNSQNQEDLYNTRGYKIYKHCENYLEILLNATNDKYKDIIIPLFKDIYITKMKNDFSLTSPKLKDPSKIKNYLKRIIDSKLYYFHGKIVREANLWYGENVKNMRGELTDFNELCAHVPSTNISSKKDFYFSNRLYSIMKECGEFYMSRPEEKSYDFSFYSITRDITYKHIKNRIVEDTVKNTLRRAEKSVERNPTEKQIKAGNYKKGHINILGFDISIENPKGSYREGVDEKGKKWKTKINNTYGYFNRSVGYDGDAVDVFIGDNLESDRIFCIDQYYGNDFDETKVMLCFDNKRDAKKAYMSNYEKGWKGFKYITELDVDSFKEWLYNGKKQRKPIALTKYINKISENNKIVEDLEYYFADDAGVERDEYTIGMEVPGKIDETNIVKDGVMRVINELRCKDVEMLLEREGVSMYPFKKEIERIVKYLDMVVSGNPYYTEYEGIIPESVLPTFPWIKKLNIKYRIYNYSSKEDVEENGTGAYDNLNYNKIENDKLCYVEIYITGIAIRNELVVNSVKPFLYHELNHAYQNYKMLLEDDEYGLEQQNDIYNYKKVDYLLDKCNDKDINNMCWILYWLLTPSERNAHIEQLYGEFQSGNIKSFKDSHVYAEYTQVKDVLIPAVKKLDNIRWGVFAKELLNYNTTSIEGVRNRFNRECEKYLDYMLRKMGRTQSLYYENLDIRENYEPLRRNINIMKEIKWKKGVCDEFIIHKPGGYVNWLVDGEEWNFEETVRHIAEEQYLLTESGDVTEVVTEAINTDNINSPVLPTLDTSTYADKPDGEDENNPNMDADDFLDKSSEFKLQTAIDIINKKMKEPLERFTALKYILDNIDKTNMTGQMHLALRNIVMSEMITPKINLNKIEESVEHTDVSLIVNSLFEHHLINENVSADTKIIGKIVSEMILKDNKKNGKIILKYSDIADNIKLSISIDNTIINYNIIDCNNIVDLKKHYLMGDFVSHTDFTNMSFSDDYLVSGVILELNLGTLNGKPTAQYFYNQIYHEVDHVFNFFENNMLQNRPWKTIEWRNKFSHNSYNDKRFEYFDDILHWIFYFTDYSEQMGIVAGYYGARIHKDETLEISNFYEIINNLEHYIKEIQMWKEGGIFEHIRRKYSWNNLSDEKIRQVLINYCKKSIKLFKQKLRQSEKSESRKITGILFLNEMLIVNPYEGKNFENLSENSLCKQFKSEYMNFICKQMPICENNYHIVKDSLVDENVLNNTKILSKIIFRMILEDNKKIGEIVLRYDDIVKLGLFLPIDSITVKYNIIDCDNEADLKKRYSQDKFLSNSNTDGKYYENNIVLDFSLGTVKGKPVHNYFYVEIYCRVQHVLLFLNNVFPTDVDNMIESTVKKIVEDNLQIKKKGFLKFGEKAKKEVEDHLKQLNGNTLEEGIIIPNEYENEILDTLGKGSFGTAYLLKNGHVLKVTSDGSEVVTALQMVGKTYKHLANIYKVSNSNIENKKLIEMEYIDVPKVTIIVSKFIKKVAELYPDVDYNEPDELYPVLGDISRFYEEVNDLEMVKFVKDLKKVIIELAGIDGVLLDLNNGNIGYKKNGNMCLFDMSNLSI